MPLFSSPPLINMPKRLLPELPHSVPWRLQTRFGTDQYKGQACWPVRLISRNPLRRINLENETLCFDDAKIKLLQKKKLNSV